MPLTSKSHRSLFAARVTGICRMCFFVSAIALLSSLVASQAFANVRPIGQVSGLDPNASDQAPIVTATGPLLVGATLPGGIFIDLAPTTIGLEGPFVLSGTSANLGITRTGIGRIALTQGTMDLSTDLTVGDAGIAELELDLSSYVNVLGSTIVGNQSGGSGIVDINTVLSRLSTDTLIVGNEGQGQVDIATTGLLRSRDTTVGSAFTGVGLVRMNEDTMWNVDGQFVIGDEGSGDVVLNQFSQISAVADPNGGPDPNVAVVGNAATGLGSVTLNDSSHFFLDRGLTVGREGMGTVVLNGASRLFTGNTTDGEGDSTVGSADGSTGHVTLNGTSRWDVRGNLNIAVAPGGDPNTSSALGTVSVNDSAFMQVDPESDIIIGKRGELNLGGGTLKQLQSGTTTAIANWGVIRGKGTLDAQLDITSSGELRNAADLANQPERLLVTLEVTVAGNSDAVFDTVDGLIESQGGEMEFHGQVTNDGVIVIDDATMRFRGKEVSGAADDLVNNGLVTMGPGSTLYGDINSGGGSLIVDLTTGLMPTQIYGDVIFTTPIVAAITDGGEFEPQAALAPQATGLGFEVDEDSGVLDVRGEIQLDAGNTILDFDYLSSVPSQSGDTIVLATANSIVGDFFNSQIEADGFLWDINVIGNEIVVTNTGMLSTGILGDFNGDGRVDARDFLEWQRDPTIGDLADWTANYGLPISSNVSIVPEPSTLLLALGLLTLKIRRRERT